MSQVSMQLVKELRDRTQAGLNDCKAALVEAEGHLENAVVIIQKKGPRQEREARRRESPAKAWVVTSVTADGKLGAIAEVNIQTDFAARNPEFVAFTTKVVEAALKAKLGADLGAEPFPGGAGHDSKKNRAALVGKLGETSPCAAGIACRSTALAACTPTCTRVAKSASCSPFAPATMPRPRRPRSRNSWTTARCKSPPCPRSF